MVLASTLALGFGLGLSWLLTRGLSRQYAAIRSAEQLATHMARARQEVLAMVSHDLRNPLQTVLMASSVLELSRDDDGGRRHARAIHNAALRMRHMIEELVTTSQLEPRARELDREPVVAAELVDLAISMFEVRAHDAGVELRHAAYSGGVLADRERVLEVLANLIDNALRYTPRAGTIAVSAEPRGRAVRFAVRDSGAGVPTEHVPHLFERFWQGPERRITREGLGLGLYICKRIVDAHGGSIGVDSEIGLGSTFWFTLPALDPSP
jgi:signal transduction histidine kinase